MKKIVYTGETGQVRVGDKPLANGATYGDLDDETTGFLLKAGLATEAGAVQTPAKKPTTKAKG